MKSLTLFLSLLKERKGEGISLLWVSWYQSCPVYDYALCEVFWHIFQVPEMIRFELKKEIHFAVFLTEALKVN